jgi:hypothetical protein
MRTAIAALGNAQSIISRRTDKAIEHGLASLELVEQVTASASAVREAMSDFQNVDNALGPQDGQTAGGVAGGRAPEVPTGGGR